MKLDQDDATQICKRVVDHGVGTAVVAEQFEVSRRRVQQLAKTYRETNEIHSWRRQDADSTPSIPMISKTAYSTYASAGVVCISYEPLIEVGTAPASIQCCVAICSQPRWPSMDDQRNLHRTAQVDGSSRFILNSYKCRMVW